MTAKPITWTVVEQPAPVERALVLKVIDEPQGHPVRLFRDATPADLAAAGYHPATSLGCRHPDCGKDAAYCGEHLAELSDEALSRARLLRWPESAGSSRSAAEALRGELVFKLTASESARQTLRTDNERLCGEVLEARETSASYRRQLVDEQDRHLAMERERDGARREVAEASRRLAVRIGESNGVPLLELVDRALAAHEEVYGGRVRELEYLLAEEKAATARDNDVEAVREKLLRQNHTLASQYAEVMRDVERLRPVVEIARRLTESWKARPIFSGAIACELWDAVKASDPYPVPPSAMAERCKEKMADKFICCPSHCCKEHGCKYGFTSCPVVSGAVEQENQCEDCEQEEREDLAADALPVRAPAHAENLQRLRSKCARQRRELRRLNAAMRHLRELRASEASAGQTVVGSER